MPQLVSPEIVTLFVPSFLFHHGCHSEARELKTCIPMEVFLSRGDDGLDSFLGLATWLF